MRPCQKCKKKKWIYRFFDETRIVRATCICGNIVEFKAKPRKPYNPNKIEAKAEYENRGGKLFLKIDGEFVPVELARVDKKSCRCPNGKYLRVMPIIGYKITKLKPYGKTF